VTPAVKAQACAVDRKALGIVFAVVVMDLVGAGILLPILPYYARQFRADALTVGLLSMAFSAAQFLASPVLGVLSDRYGRRPILLGSILGSAFGYFLFGIGHALWILFLARIIDGVTGGNISTAQSYIADITPPEQRAKNFGLIGAAFGLGFILGPALGGLLAKISLAAPAYGAGICGLLTFAAALFFLPESLPSQRRRTGGFAWTDLDPFRSLIWGLRQTGLRWTLAAVFLFNFPFSALQSNFALFTLARFGLGASQNAVLFTFLGFLVALLQGFVFRRFLRNFGAPRYAEWGIAAMAAGFAVLAMSSAMWMVYTCLVFTAVGSALAGPTLTGMVSHQVAAGDQGMAMGITMSLASLTRVLGPLWAGLFFDHVGPAAPYWTGVIWLAAAVVMAGMAGRRVIASRIA
jgi:multidrug resistance protein